MLIYSMLFHRFRLTKFCIHLSILSLYQYHPPEKHSLDLLLLSNKVYNIKLCKSTKISKLTIRPQVKTKIINYNSQSAVQKQNQNFLSPNFNTREGANFGTYTFYSFS
jgi:hypothetical protein